VLLYNDNYMMSNNWVEEVLDRYHLRNEYTQQRALTVWSDVAGDRIARLARAVRFQAGVLWVEVSSPSVAQELSYLKESYRVRLNDLLAHETVCNIRFIPGRFEHEQTCVRVKLTETDREESRSLFQEVQDSTLRHAFERLYLTLLQREKALLQSGGKRCPRCGVAFMGREENCAGCRIGGIADTKGKD